VNEVLQTKAKRSENPVELPIVRDIGVAELSNIDCVFNLLEVSCPKINCKNGNGKKLIDAAGFQLIKFHKIYDLYHKVEGESFKFKGPRSP